MLLNDLPKVTRFYSPSHCPPPSLPPSLIALFSCIGETTNQRSIFLLPMEVGGHESVNLKQSLVIFQKSPCLQRRKTWEKIFCSLEGLKVTWPLHVTSTVASWPYVGGEGQDKLASAQTCTHKPSYSTFTLSWSVRKTWITRPLKKCNCHRTCFNGLHVKMRLLYLKSGAIGARESSWTTKRHT